ncbi:MAG: hypothetical protein H7Y00_07125 [Fimbriimonadaceae bacterium]|nr:hypothetical protein [Chitinophagales bacterium]
MQELINKLKETAGINDEQAKLSIETISKYLKDKMPKSFHSQIDNMMNGGKLSEGIKEKLIDSAVDAKEKVEDVFDEVKDKISDLFNKKKD